MEKKGLSKMFCRAKEDGRDEEKQGRATPTFPSFGAVKEGFFFFEFSRID